MNAWSVVLAMVAAVQSASAEPCAPRAHLDGDAEAVTRVSAALHALGIEVAAAGRTGDRCPVVVAAVELDRGGGIAVAVRDGTNRSEGRVVSDAALAAAWIDSWIHDDFAPEAAPSPAVPLAPPASVVPASRADAAPSPVPSLLDRFAVDAGYLESFALDGSRGSGVTGAVCVRAGAVCVGGRVAVASLDVPAGATRDDLSVTATASWSHALGSMVIAPELGIGVGRMTTDACAPPPMCDPATMMCPAAPNGPACSTPALHQVSYTPRVGATLRASLPLFAHVWLDGTASFVVAPFGADSLSPPPDASGNLMSGAVPGEPSASAQLGVGVRVGLP